MTLHRVSGLARSTSLRQVTVELKGAWPYQIPGVKHLQSHRHCLLADEPGLGKTFMVLMALPRRARCVVVCPKSVRHVWEEEAAKFRPDLRVTLDEPMRRPHEGEILVVSWDSLPDPEVGSNYLLLEPMHDVYLVGDEVHMAKSDDALRSERWRRLGAQCGWVWGLTGTPMLGDPEDLWGVVVSCKMASVFAEKGCECGGGPREHFVHLCGGAPKYIPANVRLPNGRVVRKLRRIGFTWGNVSPHVLKRLRAGGMLRRFRADVLPDLPERQYVDVPVAAPADLRDFLDEMHDKWSELDEEAQLGNIGFELLSQARKALAISRADDARDFANAHASLEAPMLVFSAHVEPVRAVGELRGAAWFTGDDSSRGKGDKARDQIVKDFKAGKLRILAMTIATGGVGLNLTAAASQLFVDLDWTPGKNEQAELRSARPGQKRPRIPIYRMVSRHPLDLRVHGKLADKQRLISAATGRPRSAAKRSARPQAGKPRRRAPLLER